MWHGVGTCHKAEEALSGFRDGHRARAAPAVERLDALPRADAQHALQMARVLERGFAAQEVFGWKVEAVHFGLKKHGRERPCWEWW